MSESDPMITDAEITRAVEVCDWSALHEVVAALRARAERAESERDKAVHTAEILAKSSEERRRLEAELAEALETMRVASRQSCAPYSMPDDADACCASCACRDFLARAAAPAKPTYVGVDLASGPDRTVEQVVSVVAEPLEKVDASLRLAKAVDRQYGTDSDGPPCLFMGFFGPPCDLGHGHANKWEATVCESTRRGLTEGEWCISGARMLLPGISRGGEACYFTPDFTVWRAGADGRPELVRCYDAKAGRHRPKRKRSPEWRRGRMAFTAEYGVEVVEVSPAGEGGKR